MHDSQELISAFNFKNGDGAVIVVDDAIVTYELFLNPNGGGVPVKQVIAGPGAVFDLIPATAADLLAAFPGPTPPTPGNGVWVAAKPATSPPGNFFVKATASPAGFPVVGPVTGALFPVTRDPSVPVTGAQAPLSTPRARQH